MIISETMLGIVAKMCLKELKKKNTGIQHWTGVQASYKHGVVRSGGTEPLWYVSALVSPHQE